MSDSWWLWVLAWGGAVALAVWLLAGMPGLPRRRAERPPAPADTVVPTGQLEAESHTFAPTRMVPTVTEEAIVDHPVAAARLQEEIESEIDADQAALLAAYQAVELDTERRAAEARAAD